MKTLETLKSGSELPREPQGSSGEVLEFSRCVRYRRAVRAITWLIAINIAVCAGVFAWRQWFRPKDYAERQALFSAEQVCREFSREPNFIVMTNDHEIFPKVKDNPEFTPRYPFGSGSEIWEEDFRPRAWADLNAAATAVGGPTTMPGPLANDAIVFIHERRTPRWQQELVIITGTCWCTPPPPWAPALGPPFSQNFSPHEPFELHAYLLPPVGWKGSPRFRESGVDVTPTPAIFEMDFSRVQIFAGQADRSDESHFTIRIKMGPREATYDGWLKDGIDGPRVTIEHAGSK